jgi:hypothetical protein
MALHRISVLLVALIAISSLSSAATWNGRSLVVPHTVANVHIDARSKTSSYIVATDAVRSPFRFCSGPARKQPTHSILTQKRKNEWEMKILVDCSCINWPLSSPLSQRERRDNAIFLSSVTYCSVFYSLHPHALTKWR